MPLNKDKKDKKDKDDNTDAEEQKRKEEEQMDKKEDKKDKKDKTEKKRQADGEVDGAHDSKKSKSADPSAVEEPAAKKVKTDEPLKDPPKKLEPAESQALNINSSTHRIEYAAFDRLVANPGRCPFLFLAAVGNKDW